MFVTLAAYANPSLPHILNDHMVLQRDRPIHIWGWATLGERVVVTLADAKRTAVADAQRRWSVTLPALPAGGPYTITIAGRKTIELKDVLIGEVWIASGQSNMTYALKDAAGGAAEVEHSDYAQIRLFTVPHELTTRKHPDVLPAEWHTCSPDSAKDFSAVGYYFARDVHRKLGVPVGIIESAWQGSPIEDWIPPSEYESDSNLKAITDKWKSEPIAVRAYADVPKLFDLQFKDFELLRPDGSGEPVSFADFYQKENGAAVRWSYDWADAPRTFFEVLNRSVAHISGPLDQGQQSLANAFWQSERTSVDLSQYTGIRFKVRGDGSFRIRFLQPTITDWDDYASRFEPSSADWETVTIHFSDLHQEGWGVWHDFTPAAQTGLRIESVSSVGYPDRPPSGMFRGMIEPLLNFQVRGAIWYQGESNALQATLYREELPALIRGWRASWKDPGLSFLVVQLPNHGLIPKEPGSSAWAELRDAQFHTYRTMSNVGLIVTIDVGDPNNVHPARKEQVGARLALWALGTTYKQSIVYSGPIFDSMEASGSSVIVHFTHADGALATSDHGPVKGFAIAGSDGVFHWAKAEIAGNTVIVSSADVPSPVSIRYAWAESPICNLTNAAGLPASPFEGRLQH
jgi:sialate O-acetylesterase